MTGSFAAEMLKLRKRPAIWALGALVAAMVALLGYTSGLAELPPDLARVILRPEALVTMTLDVVAKWSGPVALILGAMVGGSEYGWNTLKTVLTKCPSRLSVLSGMLVGLGATAGVFGVLSFAAAAASSLAVAQVIDTTIRAPHLWDLARGLGTAWLIFGAWSAVGLALGVLFRGTTFAVGLGLIYALVIETLVAEFRGAGLLGTMREWMIGPNAEVLASSFIPEAHRMPTDMSGGIAEAALVLAGYIVGAAALGGILLRRRDVV